MNSRGTLLRFTLTGHALIFLVAMSSLLVGCATGQHKDAPPAPPAQRGWVGGQYRIAETPRWFGTEGAIEAFPHSIADKQKTGVLITELNTNTPARQAGLREGDL